MWHNEWGEDFNSYEEAREETLKHMDEEDYLDVLTTPAIAWEIVKWAMKKEDFYDQFQDKIDRIEQEFLDEYLWEEEEEE